MKKLVIAMALAATTASVQASTTPNALGQVVGSPDVSTVGNTTTYSDDFGNFLGADGDFQISSLFHPHLTYNFTTTTTSNLDLSFWYSAPYSLSGYGSVTLASQTFALQNTTGTTNALLSTLNFNLTNPGPDAASVYDQKFSGSISGLAAGSYTLSFDAASSFKVFKIDDLKLVVTSVPEPESYAMLLAGLGLMGAVARRRRVKG